MPEVNPAILRWARETADVTPEQAVRKIQLGDARGVSAVDRLASLESGEAQPTRAQLERMAKAYRRPLITFYLAAPPPRGDRGQDFRSLPQDHADGDEAILDVLIRRVQSSQRLLRALLEDEDEAVSLTFVGSMRRSDGVMDVVESIRDTVGLPISEFRRQPNADSAFAILRSHVEGTGTFVLLIGDLGSHHTRIPTATFRGFTIADPIAPVVVINDQDSRAAWSFTLVHELAHLWLGHTGVSGDYSTRQVERFCNDVASEFLLPRGELRSLLDAVESLSFDDLEMAIPAFAGSRNVSSSMVAYKLYRNEHISRDTWVMLRNRFRAFWFESRAAQRAARRERPGGATFYTLKRHRLGPGLTRLTARMVAAGSLSTTKAGVVLGVKPSQVGALVGIGQQGD